MEESPKPTEKNPSDTTNPTGYGGAPNIRQRRINPAVFRLKQRKQSSRNLNSNKAMKMKKTDLHTEIILRKEKMTPQMIKKIRKAQSEFSDMDVEQLKKIFRTGKHPSSSNLVVTERQLLERSEVHELLESLGISLTDEELDEVLKFADADGSRAIDEEEWLMLIGLLVEPPHDENELSASFDLLFCKDTDDNVQVSEFSSVITDVLAECLSASECKQIPNFLDEVLRQFDPLNTGQLNASKCIQKLLERYSSDTICDNLHDQLLNTPYSKNDHQSFTLQHATTFTENSFHTTRMVDCTPPFSSATQIVREVKEKQGVQSSTLDDMLGELEQ